MPKLEDMTPSKLRDISNQELVRGHQRLHQWWSNKGCGSATKASCEDYANKHIFVVNEMKRRGMNHNTVDSLDRSSAQLRKQMTEDGLKQFERLEDFMVTPDFISVIGSSIDSDKEPNDLDICFRRNPDDPANESLVVAFAKALGREEEFHAIFNAEGPHSDYLSLYDLVARKKTELKVTEIKQDLFDPAIFTPHPHGEHFCYCPECGYRTEADEGEKCNEKKCPECGARMRAETTGELRDRDVEAKARSLTPGRAFTLLKSGGGYGEGIYGDAETAWKTWGKDRGSIALEYKFDGFRGAAHCMGGGKRKLFTEDAKRDIGNRVPEVMEQLPDRAAIFDGELLLYAEEAMELKGREYKKGDKIARMDMPSFLMSKEPPGKFKPEYHVFDCVYDGEDLHTQEWDERQKHLKKLIKDKAHVKRVKPTVVSSKGSFLSNVKRIRNKKDSEGVMCKDCGSDYPLTGHTSGWVKVKNYKELHVKVTDRKQTKGGEWIYTCALSDGTKIGKTYATSEKWPVGFVISVYVAEVKYSDGKFTWDNAIAHHRASSAEASVTTPEQARRLAGAGRGAKEILKALFGEDFEEAWILEKDDEGSPGNAEWTSGWHESYPKSGKGRWSYQRHWRGLSEDEAKLSEEELFKTTHSVHGDLRCQFSKEALFGFTPFLGKTSDEAKAGKGGRLANLPEDDKLQGSWKLQQPVAWLTICHGKPYVAEPGSPGATSQSYAKFFEVDSGTYDMGVWRKHAMELFLHGKILKGRFQIVYAPVGGSRKWLIGRPKDQTPYAQSHDKEKIIKELKGKRQKWLVWAEPGKKPEKIQISKAKDMDTNLRKFGTFPAILKSFEKDGEAYWVSVTSTAFKDREKEIVSRNGLDYAVDFHDATGMRGGINLYHVRGGKEVATCDFSMRVDKVLLEAGRWLDNEFAHFARKWVEDEKERQPGELPAMSVEFWYDEDHRRGEVYDKVIIFRRALLLSKDAANPWTWFEAPSEGDKMADKTDLAKILGSDELAEKYIKEAEAVSKKIEELGIEFKEMDMEELEDTEVMEDAEETEEVVEETKEVEETEGDVDEKAKLSALAKKLQTIAGKVEDDKLAGQIKDIAKALTEYGYGKYEAPKKEQEDEAVQELVLTDEAISAIADEVADRLGTKGLADSLVALTAKVDGLAESDEAKVAEKVRRVPAETRVVIRESERKADESTVKEDEIIEPEETDEDSGDVKDKIFDAMSQSKLA